jgi:3'(2'), 5'-bisphosphate nucleotidase
MITEVCQLARRAGERVLSFYGSHLSVKFKPDSSPLTAADEASHQLLEAGLKALAREWPVVSEESVSPTAMVDGICRKFWLVDPLDGTKEFLKGTGEFTVNVALIERGVPVLGVVHAPALDLTYFAEQGKTAFRQSPGQPAEAIRTRPADPSHLVVASSRDHAGPRVHSLMAGLNGAVFTPMGSSLKFCLVAEGKADLYLRDLPTMEWDTAAAQCVVEAAGGGVYDLSGCPLRYGKPSLTNPPIMTAGDPNLEWLNYLPARSAA